MQRLAPNKTFDIELTEFKDPQAQQEDAAVYLAQLQESIRAIEQAIVPPTSSAGIRDTWYYYQEYLQKKRSTPELRIELIAGLIRKDYKEYPHLSEKPAADSAPILFLANRSSRYRAMVIPSLPTLVADLLQRYPNDYTEAQLRSLALAFANKGKENTARVILAAAERLKKAQGTGAEEPAVPAAAANNRWMRFSYASGNVVRTSPVANTSPIVLPNSSNPCSIM